MSDNNWVPEYKIKVGGSELPQTDGFALRSLMVDLRRQEPASAELLFNNKSGTYDQEETFSPGSEISIALGYSEQEKKVVFTGEIANSQVRLQGDGTRVFVVRAFDFLHRMTRGRKTRTFLEQKYSEIVEQVASDAGLSPETEDTKFKREYVIQHNQTDLDFVRGLAGWLDYDLHIRHMESPTKLRFKKPEIGGDSVIKAVYEKPDMPAEQVHLQKLDGHVNLSRVVTEVVVRGWNPKEKKEIVGKCSTLHGSMGGSTSAVDEVKQKWGDTVRQIVDYKAFSQDEADAIADAKINEYARTFLRADIFLQGTAVVVPGALVEVSLVGPRYDGKYLVEKVTHRFQSAVGPDEGGFTTRFLGSRNDW